MPSSLIRSGLIRSGLIRSGKYPAAVAALALMLAALMMVGCSGGGGDEGAAGTAPDWPAKAQAGEAAFNARCAVCHGGKAAGTGLGPPLAHRIYEPGHHQDFAFRNAVRNGVVAHHWQFGDMPPVPGVSDGDIEAIICYVRELQRAAGIIAESRC